MKPHIKYILIFFFAIGYSQDDSRGSVGESNENIVEGNKYAIIIGISDYFEDNLKLNYADNDAALFKNYLSDIEKIPEENIELLINKNAVALNIENAFRQIAKKIAENDIVYVYFAGHGDVVEDFGYKEGYLLAADSNANREYVGTGGVIALDRLNNRIIRALTQKNANVILILDACRSGFIFEDGPQKNMGTLQAMFENTSKFLSCGVDELSYESSDLQHGYFTHYFVKGLTGEADDNADNELQFREIDDYLYDNVASTVSEKHNQKQTPVVRTKDARAILKKIKEEDKIVSFEDVKKAIDQTKVIAARSITDTDKSLPAQVTQFANAIKSESYYGKSSSAYDIYKKAKADNSISESYLEKMKTVLLSQLSSSAQQLINRYISGEKKLPNARTFQREAKHLDICLELMDDDNLLKDRITVSKLMLEAYSIIRNRNTARYGLAKKKLLNALNIEPRAAYVHNAMGIVYNYEAVYDSAYYHFNTAKKLINTWETPQVNLGDNYIDQYKFDEATEIFNTAVGINGNDIYSKLRLAEINISQGKYHIAEKIYKEILETERNNSEALEGLANIETLKGNNQAANEWYTKISKTNTIDLLRYIEAKKLDDKSAEQLLLNAIDSEPEISKRYSDYADYLRTNTSKLTRLKLADSLYKTAIVNDKKNIAAYAGRAWLFYKLNRKAKSKQWFIDGIANNPINSDIHLKYGEFLEVAFKNDSDAITQYQTAIDKNKNNINAYVKLVDVYNRLKETDKSIALLKTAMQEQPNVPELWNLLGKTHFANANYTEAINSYKKAIAIDESYSKIHSNLGYSAVESNDVDTAKKHFSISSSQNKDINALDDIAAYIINAAKTKMSFGTPSDAKALYKLAYDIHPTFTTGYEYAKFLYLQEETTQSIEIAESLADKIKTKANKIDIIKLLVKATIDANDSKKCDAYYNGLLALKTQQQDFLLAAVYSSYKGNLSAYNSLLSKVNPFLIKDNKLKDDYSKSTVSKYILRN
ncbi:MAG: tetratricopeptide repeat protein [Winogradskyella sp.]|uniref:tetratricopeptide repeat protein n=1 Tax=Winogradskyella sp. TaxID=1883156 RepID=UPI000F41AF7B|nr:tetratricopeptide repeat protein [Winogradskyella sp.]RNC86711.1 MAG: tetratricopeptide repeat protein [Winogradskyella sp.]